jgi:hypothetical protein
MSLRTLAYATSCVKISLLLTVIFLYMMNIKAALSGFINIMVGNSVPLTQFDQKIFFRSMKGNPVNIFLFRIS